MAEQDNKPPSRWEPGVDVDSEQKYNKFTEQLAQELLSDCTPEHIAVIAAQHMIYADLLSRSLDESRKLIHAKGALDTVKIQQAEARFDVLTQKWAQLTTSVLIAYRKKAWGAGAKARHAPTNQRKVEALAEWESNGANVSSMAAFARCRHKDFGVTERTLYGWIRAHRGNTL